MLLWSGWCIILRQDKSFWLDTAGLDQYNIPKDRVDTSTNRLFYPLAYGLMIENRYEILLTTPFYEPFTVALSLFKKPNGYELNHYI